MTTPQHLVTQTPNGHLIKHWTRGVLFEDKAEAQVANAAALPFIHKHIAVMPDVHSGIGATVGSVIPTRGAIIPAAVGVDIGCGMVAQLTGWTASQLPDSLSALRHDLESAIPHGRTNNGGPGDRGAWHDVPLWASSVWSQELADKYTVLVDRNPALKTRTGPVHHLGTLGTGNHFVEVCLDEAQRVWIMLHSGSRGIGNRIGNYFIELAKEDMRKWFINLPDQDLAYLPEGTQHFGEYIQAVQWAQHYAAMNRRLMLNAAWRVLDAALPTPTDVTPTEAINCHHNYVALENHFGANVWVTRKGAVRARAGDLGIIPGSMGARSYIVRGLGNPESFHSCSHGAGRKMSRTAARKQFTVEDHAAATQGVECRKDADVIDETPAAYKDIDAVMAAQSDLVAVVHTLKQVLCVKG